MYKKQFIFLLTVLLCSEVYAQRRLFPVTYYYDVAHRIFSLDGKDSLTTSYDTLMMKTYILHPELVKETEGKLRKDGKIVFSPVTPVRQDVDFTSQAEDDDTFRPSVNAGPEPAVDAGKVDLFVARPNFWTFTGDYSLQFLQNYVSDNWYKGGESNYAMIGAVTLQANYNDKDKIKWDNKLEMKLGMQSSREDSVHKYKSSEDLIRLTSKLGVQATKRWYYTLQLIAQTQFSRGFKNNDLTVYSDFLSPLTMNLSLGMDYKVSWCKNRLTGTFNISPVSANLKYYDRLDCAVRNSVYDLVDDVKVGKHSQLDYGSTLTADLTWQFSKIIKWQTRLYGFTSYKRSQVEWENTVTLQVSRFISTKLFVYPRFDDSAKRDDDYGYFQLKEYLSLGFNYSF
ncbi:MAG: DUF3078 domain-containing protein [Bacteroidales bacterium]|nr:DUF3078 domain-containing protein [Bacteroidales bacterium]MCM1146728.1 DUF3078 domain-containing protein [Bacteroidales bacterium]MCM1205545.1 DUF3078 domain-containing protein [Bacillota bacterium]MCM1509193.1 DUF3078 domain-containing protein [Clostridium sp.]